MQITIFVSLALSLFNQASAGQGWRWRTGNLYNSWERDGIFIGTSPACSATCSDCFSRGMHCWFSVTSGDGHYCSSGRKVYCHTRGSPYNGAPYWVGTAPFCQGGCGDCAHPAVCIATDGSGDGNSCSCSRGWFGCTNEKAMCVNYNNRRRLPEDIAQNFTRIVKPLLFKGIDIGFYIHLGDEFEDESLFESHNGTLSVAFTSAVASALTNSIPGVATTADLGSVREYGFVGQSKVDTNYTVTFQNATLVTYINLQFIYATESKAAHVEAYLHDPNNIDTFSNAVTTALGGTNEFSGLGYNIHVYFVEANTFASTIEELCDAINDQETAASQACRFCHLLSFQFLAILLSIWNNF